MAASLTGSSLVEERFCMVTGGRYSGSNPRAPSERE
jgi:hypothetical protein